MCSYSFATCGSAVCVGFASSSALFRHEIAYVLGQMQEVVTVTGLRKHLDKEAESGMVRHECAEALGSVGTEECTAILKVIVTAFVIFNNLSSWLAILEQLYLS